MTLKQIVDRLLQLDTACICDAEKALDTGLRVMSPQLRPVGSGVRMAGPAHTIRCHNDFLAVIQGLIDAVAGEVLVIDSQASTKAVTGELFPTEAMRKGLAGIVNDGPCRDVATVREMEFAYFARSVSCIPGTTVDLGETQVPILCGGVVVRPGEVVFGDDDGLMVASAEQFATLIPVAEEIQAAESRLLEQMSAGRPLIDMLNFREHCDRLRKGEPTKLSFVVEPRKY